MASFIKSILTPATLNRNVESVSGMKADFDKLLFGPSSSAVLFSILCLSVEQWRMKQARLQEKTRRHFSYYSFS